MFGFEVYLGTPLKSQAYAEIFANSPGSLVVLDLGATESAGSADAVTEMIVEIQKNHPEVTIEFDKEDRAWFRFADGEWRQALSCARIGTRLGVFNIYVLDVEKTPILFSVNAMRSLGAVICVQDAVMALKRFPNEKPIKLARLPSGHLAMDMKDLCEPTVNHNSE